MRFYFDIAFLESIQDSTEIEKFIFEDFKYFIESLHEKDNDQYVHCYLINEFEVDYELFSKNLFYRILANLPNYKRITLSKYSSDLEEENDNCFKFYFLNEKDSANEIRKKYGYYACCSGELNIIWKKFYSRRANEDLKRYIGNEKTKYQFNSWEDLNEFALPINTIVISDLYLFEYIESFSFNFCGLLKNIGLAPLTKRTIDIIIMTSDKIFKDDKELEGQNSDERIERAFLESKKIISNFLKDDKFNLTLIKLDKASNPKISKAHFRSCITNTTFINPHHSFTIFGEDNQVRKNEYIEFTSFLWGGPRQNAIDGVLKIVVQAMLNINNETKVWDKNYKTYITKRLLFHNTKKCGFSFLE